MEETSGKRVSKVEPVSGTAPKVIKATEGRKGMLDRRCVRSRRMIYRALIDLIEERGLDGFTVADITARADLNRSTFYSHFRDKDDLIARFEDDFLKGLTDIEAELGRVSQADLALAAMGVTPLRPLVDIFDFIKEHATVLTALLGPRGDIGFEHRLVDTLCASIADGILNPKYKENPSRVIRYYVAYFSSASLGIVRTWLEDGMKESSEDMARILLGLALLKPGESIEIEGLSDL